MKRVFAFCILFLSSSALKSQTADTAKLEEVLVRAYFSAQPLLTVPASISIINQQNIQNQMPGSLLPAINTAPGVRMEERSPGSYRLSIRGSLLRSPFGIRNVKIYMDDFILTDAGGNTYLNILDAGSVGKIEILKGPEGSVFGANSGGVVLINSHRLTSDSSSYSAGVSGGSFGFLNQNAALTVKKEKFEISANQSYQRSDGYRTNSAMNRKSFLVTPKWGYSPSADINSLIMYSDLRYETPGGLTLAQFEQDRKLARPNAAEQQAAIYNKTFLAGVSHEKRFSEKWRHVIALTGSHTNFKNPFITNYEIRKENSLGLRTYVELSGTERLNWQLGLETQQTNTDINNSENLSGEKGNLQVSDELTAAQSFLFTHLLWPVAERLTVEAALSLNSYSYSSKSIFPVQTGREKTKFDVQLLPRVALSYLLHTNLAWRASASKGYSAPTIAEVRPSGNVINKDLQPETGWNYETGLRYSAFNNRINFDGVVFYYNLKNAIVRRVNSADAEYFVNSGGTKQKGFEAQLSAVIIPSKSNGFIRSLKLIESYTASNFKFDNYTVATNNFSGNKLTGVPDHNLVSAVEIGFPARLNLYVQHNYVSSIPLNDANSAFADNYHLLQAKATWNPLIENINFRFFVGADNLLNSHYSLGNDLNAFGSRFYNPAASLNFYTGLTINF